MFHFPVRTFAAAFAVAAIPAAASSESTPVAPSARHDVGRVAAAHSGRATKRPRFTTECTTNGSGAFIGGGLSNVAGGQYAFIGAGNDNQSCDELSGIVAGSGNTIFDNGAYGAQESAIGAGSNNTISASNSFMGAGNTNVISGEYAFLGSGMTQTVSGSYAAVVGGENNSATASFALVGGGTGNNASAVNSFVGAGSGNMANGPYGFAGAGSGNSAAYAAFVGAGGQGTASGNDSFVGAGIFNDAVGNGAFVGGGGTLLGNQASPPSNVASAPDDFIGAGDANTIGTPASFVGDGEYNVIEIGMGGTYGGAYGVITGGYRNTIDPIAAGGGEFGAIGGGVSNTLYGNAATIGGGSQNKASGQYASVPGGLQNNAVGIASFAAGTKADAAHNGTFVWSDNSGTATLASTAPYQFLARAAGGFYLYSSSTNASGVKLAPGSGTWASLSDRTSKMNIGALDDAAVLAKVAALPVSTWSYRTEDPRVRHVGPMAQDFYAAFHVGEDDRHITSIDEDGVALAAIKALHTENAELRARLSRTDARFAALERKVEALARR
jgi:hypothetical protein